MKTENSPLSYLGIALGSLALMLALVHFWAGPFTPQPSLEQVVANKVVAIKDATLSALKGEEQVQEKQHRSYDLDAIASIATAVLGGLAIILGVIGYARREPGRAASGAALLGIGAITFQFLGVVLGVIVVVVLVGAVLSSIGLDIPGG